MWGCRVLLKLRRLLFLSQVVEVLEVFNVFEKAIHVGDLALAVEGALVDENRDFSSQLPILGQLVVL